MPEPASLADENPVAKAYRVWSSTCPFTSRSSMTVMVGMYLLSFPLPWISEALSNSLQYTFGKYEVYRLATSVFCSNTLITLVFALMSFNSLGPKLERSLGSAGLMALLATLTIAMNVLFLVVCYLLQHLGRPIAWFTPASGVWNLLFALTAVECMATPNIPRRFFILPFEIPGNIYPLFLCCVISIMRRSLIEGLCAVGVGYAYADGRLNRCKPSRDRLSRWESGCLSNFVNRPGYIVHGAAVGDDAFATTIIAPADHPSNQGDGGGGGGFASMFRRAGGQESSGGNQDTEGSGFGANNVINRGAGGKASGGSSFAGSGQALGSGSGSRNSGGARFSGHSQTQHDPQTARMARLAALEGRGVGGQSQESRLEEAATPLMADADHHVMTLQDMGYTAAEAREALSFTDGDVEAAVSFLTT